MRIYGDLLSGNCLKVKYTADFLALPYEWVPVDIMKEESRTPEFLALNPMGQVPVVELDDGRSIAQSNAILLYLADGTQLLPDEPFERSKVQELMFWEQYSHEPYIAVCRFQMVYLGKPAGEREAWRVQRGELALDFMDQMLAGCDWFVGDQISVADISLLAYTRLAGEGGFELSRRSRVVAWVNRCEQALAIQ